MARIVSFDDHVNSLASKYNKTGLIDKHSRTIKKAGDAY